MHAIDIVTQRLLAITKSSRAVGIARAILAFLALLTAAVLGYGIVTRDINVTWVWVAGAAPALLGLLQIRRSRLNGAVHLLGLALMVSATAALWDVGAAAWPVAYAPLAAAWLVGWGHGRPAGLPYAMLLLPAAALLFLLDAPWLLYSLTAPTALLFLWPLIGRSAPRTGWTPEAVAQLRSLKRFSQLLAQANSVREMFVNTQREIMPLFDATGISVFLLGEDEQTLQWAYGYEYGAEVDLSDVGLLPIDRGFAGHVARTAEPLLINSNLPEEMARFSSIQVGAAPGAWLGVPLIVATRPIGVLVIENSDDPAAFDQPEVELLAAIAGPLASTIHNWLQLEQVENTLETQSRQSMLLRAGAEVSAAVTTILDVHELSQQVVDLIQERFQFYYVAIFFSNEAEGVARLQAGTGEIGRQHQKERLEVLVGGPSAVGQAIASGTVQIQDLSATVDEMPFHYRLPNTVAEVAIPLRSRGRLLGALSAHSARPGIFNEPVIAALQTLSAQMAAAIENARLFAQAQTSLVRLNNLFLASRRIIQAEDSTLVYRTLSRHAATSGVVDGAHLVIRNPQAPERLHFPAVEKGSLDSYAPHDFGPQDAPFAELVPHTDIRYHVTDDAGSELDAATRDVLRRGGVGAMVMVPIYREAEWYGSLVLLRREADPLADEDIQPFITLCNQAAAALSNQTLLRETNTLYRTSRELSQVITWDDALAIAIRELAEQLGTTQCRVVLYDRRLGYGRLEMAYRDIDIPNTIQFPMEGDPVYDHLNEKQEPLVLREGESDERVVAGYLRPFDIRTSLLLPAFTQQRLIGFLTADSGSDERQFTAAQINFAQTLVDQLSTQMENLVLFDEALTRAQDMITLNQIGTMISGTLNVGSLAEIVQEQVGRLMDNSIFLLAVYDAHTRRYEPLLTSRYGEHFFSPPRRLAEEEILYEFLHHNLKVTPEIEADLASQAGLQDLYVSGWRPESALWMPMRQEGNPTGLLTVQSYRPHAYDDNHRQLLRTIANQAGLALANAQLFQRTEQTLAELRTIFEITHSASASPNPNERLRRLAQTLHETFQDAAVSILSVDRDSRRLEMLASAGNAPEEAPPLQHGVIRDSVFNDQPLLINDLRQVAGYDPQGSALSQMVVPLTVGERTIGLVNVESPTTDAFSEADLRLIQTLSVSVAASIESSRLFREIQAANERLRELDRLKMQFLANMSHELRTPLNSIIGFSRVILKGIDGPITEQQEQDLEAIYSSGQHLLSIINDILDVARIEAGKLALVFETVELPALAERAISTIRGLVRDKSIELVVDIEPDLPVIEADPVRLRQVLLNLLSNAAKFTEQGEIRLRMERYKPQNNNGIGRSVPLPAVSIIVSDTGPGIAPEFYDKVFEAFEQIDSSSSRVYEGTGLGLPITKRLVDLHQGEISFASEVERGTIFTIVLPVRQPPNRDAIDRQRKALEAAMSRYRDTSPPSRQEQENRPEPDDGPNPVEKGGD